jgi:ERF superfamily
MAKAAAKKETEMEANKQLPSLIETAVNKGASVEVIEKLLGLQERYEANQARKAFNQAISDVRADLPAITKDNKVDFTSARGRTHYQYEDLGSVVDALSPPLSRHDLSFRWRTRSDASMVYVTCILSHAQGHAEETELSCRHDDTGNKNPIQAIGSAVTYLQRYTLKAAIGIAASVDDDGQSLNSVPQQNKPLQGDKIPDFDPPKSAQPLNKQQAQARQLSKAHIDLRDGINQYIKDNPDPTTTAEVAFAEILKVLTHYDSYYHKKDPCPKCGGKKCEDCGKTGRRFVPGNPGVSKLEDCSDAMAGAALRRFRERLAKKAQEEEAAARAAQ